ncbi:MAG: leucine-rich repeat protein [Hyperionvirus sp.]|uniref:Leucine-rich repeat protein n=1 Tax=Hyperionvirus sp. TaxID=2487770 RepID=A0A3G5ADW9_9VIRU|nr:MAG: leucine-rich repeat protein [Hyperionvirus sp.]
MSLSKEYRRSEGKYLVYRNDLKYRSERGLDKRRIIWDDLNVKYLFENVDTDSLGYRLHECRKSGMRHLDLNNLDLVVFPEIPEEFLGAVRCLFVAENDLEELPDMTDFKKLEMLEIGNNNINNLGRLPASLIEFACRSNRIKFLPDPEECPNLIRVDCSMNEIVRIPYYRKLKSLKCSNNKLGEIPELESLENLVCNNNDIVKIDERCVNLKYLDCSNNRLNHIEIYPNLVDLICSGNSSIGELGVYPNVKYIEIFMTKIRVIPFMKCLEEIFCERDMIQKISEKYVAVCDISVKIHKGKMLQITFRKK